MAIGGNIDDTMLRDSFSRIKEDIAKLNEEIYELKKTHKETLEENIQLKEQLSKTNKDMIEKVVEKTIKKFKEQNNDNKKTISNKFNKKRRILIKDRIRRLAERQDLTLPEIKNVIVDQEDLCSKASFYRYVKSMKKKKQIDYVEVDGMELVVRT